MPKHIFTYGSLMFAQVWQRVVSGHYHCIDAKLFEHARFAVKDVSYPGIITVEGGIVTGKLYLDIGASDLTALDVFEGNEYKRCRVEVATENGLKFYAETYLFLPQHRLTNKVWNPEQFSLEQFLKAHC